MIAAGAYLWSVREARGLSRNDVATYIREKVGTGTNAVQVERIEKGQVPTSTPTMAAFIEAVNADPKQVVWLILQDDVTTEAAQELALAYIKANTATPDEQERRRREALALVDQLLADPVKLGRLLQFGEDLLER